ncbi:MAG TPA: histidinol-phosphate transaminase [Rhizomicrobium sp.]|nr:histidinol-phosphate transaminase [Rhizomicrobium sp.]
MAEFDPSLNRRDWLGAALGLGVAAGLESGAKAATGDTPVRLSFNENPLGPSPRAKEAIRAQMNSLSRYTSDVGDAFRAQVAQLEGVAPEQIFLGELLEVFGLHLALLGGPGGEFIYSEPGYSALVGAVAPGGGKVVAVPLNARQEDDLPALAAAVNGATRAVYLVSPHNPSGTVSEKGALDAFIRDVSPRTLVLVDEAYLDFLDDYAERTVARFTRQGANVVVFRTFGKMYGQAGLSMGYAIVPKPLAASLAANGLGSPFEINRLAVAGAMACLGDTHYVATIRDITNKEREKWFQLFERLKLNYARSRGAFVFFETGRPHAQFAAAMLKKGVDVGRVFPPADRWTRLSFGTVEDNARARAAVESVLR